MVKENERAALQHSQAAAAQPMATAAGVMIGETGYEDGAFSS